MGVRVLRRERCSLRSRGGPAGCASRLLRRRRGRRNWRRRRAKRGEVRRWKDTTACTVATEMLPAATPTPRDVRLTPCTKAALDGKGAERHGYGSVCAVHLHVYGFTRLRACSLTTTAPHKTRRTQYCLYHDYRMNAGHGIIMGVITTAIIQCILYGLLYIIQ